MKEIGKALITMRNMVDSFVSLGWSQWNKINEEYNRDPDFKSQVDSIKKKIDPN